MKIEKFRTFSAFWPFHLAQHSNRVCRGFHYAGTLVGTFLFTLLLARGNYSWLPLSLVPGYAFAWVGHFVFERNQPATFQYPRWSFFADFVMLGRFLTGRIEQDRRSRS